MVYDFSKCDETEEKREKYHLGGLKDTSSRKVNFILLFFPNLPSMVASLHTIVPAERKAANHL